jgi:pimeloyl-ACP methyl ester carboxylesterase
VCMSRSRVEISPMVPVIPDDMVEELTNRLARSRMAHFPDQGWQFGTPATWLEELIADWKAFDFSAFQAQLGEMPHMTARIGEQQVHFLHAVGTGRDPLPLVLTHGWPGSFLEYGELLPLLVDPGSHGGDPADAFTVVVPSLPGFGFSSAPPPGGLTASEIAELWHQLMHEGLGHARYAAHGSDLGAGVTAWLARDHPDAVAAIHLATPGLGAPPLPWTAPEESHFAEVGAWQAEEGGYAHQHATKPATMAAGLLDSPAGLAAWVGEKIVAWSSTAPDGSPSFPRRLLLDTLTLYWSTGTIGTSLMPYWTHRHRANAALPADDPSSVPTAISIFGGERAPFPKPPRQLAERYFRVTNWVEHNVGGHFPAVSEPELLAQALRQAFRALRTASPSNGR